jgi:hypothetical protein
MKMIGMAGATLAAAGHAHAVDKYWNAAVGNWSESAKWSPSGLPTSLDRVFIGHANLAENATLTTTSRTIAQLSVIDGMTLRVMGDMTVNGNTTLSGRNTFPDEIFPSTIHLVGSGFGSDLFTDHLTVQDGAFLRLEQGTRANVGGLLSIASGGFLIGEGEIVLTSDDPVALRNNGYILCGEAGLTIRQTGQGRIDLDGTTSGDISLDVDHNHMNVSSARRLTIIGEGLADPMDDNIQIVANGRLDMQLSEGWMFTDEATLTFRQPGGVQEHAVLDGTHVDFRGRIVTSSPETDARVQCPITFNDTPEVHAYSDSQIAFMDTTVINAGEFNVPDHTGQISFFGPTTVRGGTFRTDSAANPQSLIVFGGSTTLNGNAEMIGYVVLNGPVTVTGQSVINAERYDMDGSGGLPSWTIQHGLTINADAVDLFANVLGCDFTITNTFLGKLTLNLSTPGDRWRSDGVMTLGGAGILLTRRLAGSPVDIAGTLNILNRVVVEAPLALLAGSTTIFAAPTDELTLDSDSVIRAQATILGGGTLVAAPGRNFTLADQADTGSSPLLNRGEFHVADGAGRASVAAFTNDTTGTLNVELGGLTPGETHDQLVVTAPAGATLGGTLSVDLLKAGDTTYVPPLGARYTILTSRFPITGAFASVPVTAQDGLVIEWGVEYTPTEVRLRVDAVNTRCPADFNMDGFLDFFDYLDYVECYEGGSCPPSRTADINADGFLDFFDYDDFVALFEAGC